MMGVAADDGGPPMMGWSDDRAAADGRTMGRPGVDARADARAAWAAVARPGRHARRDGPGPAARRGHRGGTSAWRPPRVPRVQSGPGRASTPTAPPGGRPARGGAARWPGGPRRGRGWRSPRAGPDLQPPPCRLVPRRLGQFPGRHVVQPPPCRLVPRRLGRFPGRHVGQRGGFRRPGTKRGITRERRGRGLRGRLGLGLSAGVVGLRLGYSPGTGYDSGYGSGYDSGYGTGYGTGYGYGTGSGDAYANTSSDASSTDSDSSRTDAAQETKSDSQQDAAAAEQGDQTSNPDPDGTKTATDSAAAADRGYQAFDRGRDAFKAGDYAAALDLTDEALKGVPGDPLVHEFKALVLFARGEDPRAAAELHDVLAVRPGMDWTTMSGLYPDVATYTGQLRALEDRCRQDPKAAGAPLRPGLPLPGRRAQRRGRGAAQSVDHPGARRPGGSPPPRVADRNPSGAARVDNDSSRARPRRGRRATPVGGPRRPLEGRARRVDVRPEPRRPGPVRLAGGTPGEGHRHRLRRLRPLRGHADPQSRGPVSSPCLRDRVVSGLLPIKDRR